MSSDLVAQLAAMRDEIAQLKNERVTYRTATVLAVDPVVSTFDADVAGAGLLTGIPVSRDQFLPAVGDTVVLTVAGATPVYNRPSRVLPSVTDPVTGETLAAIGEDGQVSGQVGNFESLTIGGQPFVPTAAEDQEKPRGVVSYGGKYTDSVSSSAEVGIFEVAADLELGRLYRIETTSLLINGTAGAIGRAQIRMNEAGTTPILTDQVIASIQTEVSANFRNQSIRRMHTPLVTGTHRFLLTVARVGGTAGSVLISGNETSFPMQMWVEDVGPYRGNNAVLNNGGGVATTPVKTLTKRYPAIWSGTYNGTALDTFYGTEMKQGIYNGNWRGLVGFNSTQIQADLAGATIESCYAYLYANHWWNNSGGTARIGTHGHSSRPATFSATTGRWTSSGWPKPGGRRINLGVVVGGEFQSGTSKGLALGPAPSNNLVYYGRFDGAGMAKAPYLEIRYTK